METQSRPVIDLTPAWRLPKKWRAAAREKGLRQGWVAAREMGPQFLVHLGNGATVVACGSEAWKIIHGDKLVGRRVFLMPIDPLVDNKIRWSKDVRFEIYCATTADPIV